MLRAKCAKCGTIVEVRENTGEFRSCKCGAIYLDGGFCDMYRVGGDFDSFDNEWAEKNGGVSYGRTSKSWRNSLKVMKSKIIRR